MWTRLISEIYVASKFQSSWGELWSNLTMLCRRRHHPMTREAIWVRLDRKWLELVSTIICGRRELGWRWSKHEDYYCAHCWLLHDSISHDTNELCSDVLLSHSDSDSVPYGPSAPECRVHISPIWLYVVVIFFYTYAQTLRFQLCP